MLTVRLTLFATMETINLELIYADLETIERRIDKAKKNSKSGDKKYLHEIEFLERIKAPFGFRQACAEHGTYGR